MTDAQIEKALEHCSVLDTSMESCQGCPLDGLDYCITKLAGEALTLIRRQKKKIAAQREELRCLKKVHSDVLQSRDAWKAKAKRVGKQLNEEICRKQTVVEQVCCKDCKYSECCVVQIHAYSEEIAAEVHYSDPNKFYCAFAKRREEQSETD